MSLPLPDLGTLIALATLLLLLAGALAPFETMGWWAGWFGDERDEGAGGSRAGAPTRARGHLVFLSGIHSVSGRTYAANERRFLELLRLRLPDWEIVEVFPYSVTNRALTGERVFRRAWRAALGMKTSRRRIAGIGGMMINLRNAWQVAVSADRRYGPMYDEGSAELIARELRTIGFGPDRPGPVVLVGYSGGGQIALGACEPLARRYRRPAWVVSLGGVMASPRTLDGIGRVTHLTGRSDGVARIGAVAFPGRWPFVTWSAWNRARAQGIVRTVDLGPMKHTGAGGYLDASERHENGRTFVETTVDAVAAAAEEAAHDLAAHGRSGARLDAQPS